MTFQEFENNLYDDILPNKEEYIRPGQAVMNYLAEVWFEEYKRLSHIDSEIKKFDCFHNSRIIPQTLRHLERVWINYPN